MFDIIPASHDCRNCLTHVFFLGTLWPRNIVNACRKILQTLSNAWKDNVDVMMKDSFQQYTTKLGHSEEQDVLHLSLWESSGSQAHKDAEGAARKNDNV